MIINVSDYVDRWMNDYVTYYYADYDQRYGDLDKGIALFNKKYKEQIDRQMFLYSDTAQAESQGIQKQLEEQGVGAKEAAQIVNGLISGGTLDIILTKIAHAMNEGIDKANHIQDYENIINTAKSFNDLLEDGRPTIQRTQQFFDILLQGLNKISRIDPDTLAALTGIGQAMSGPGFSLTMNNKAIQKKPQILTLGEQKLVGDTIRYLNNAVKKIK